MERLIKKKRNYLAKSPADRGTNVDEAFSRLVDLTHRHLKPKDNSSSCCTIS